MKKFIIIFCLVLFITGCTGQYNVTINKDTIEEEISAKMEKTDQYNMIINNDFYPLHSNFSKIYSKKVNTDGDLIDLNAKYTYTYDDFANANSFNQCFDDKTVDIYSNDYYYIHLTKFTNCVFSANFDINIKSIYKVVSSNADEVKNNVYTWHVTEDNKDKLDVEIKFDRKKVNSFKDGNGFIGYIIIIVVFIGIIFFVKMYFDKKNNRDNF